MAYELPANLAELAPEQLQALIDEGLDAFRALNISAESPEEDIAEGERIAPLITQANARLTEVTAERAARADRAASLLQSMETPTEPEPEPEAPETPDEGGEAVVVPDEVIPAGEPVAAAAPPARRAAANAAPVTVPATTRPAVSLIAAADVPGFPTGSTLDGIDAMCAAVIARMRGLPTTHVGGPGGTRMQYGAALIRKNGYGDLTQDVIHDDLALIAAACNEHRLPGGSLVAAGGWCSPSETLLDLCQYETVDGILSIPEFQVTRGGIRWTPGPDISDIFEACGFELTEAEAIAGTAEKNCCMVECPDFEEIRLDAIGLCIKAPLLTQAAWPELVRRFAEGALVGQAHKVNKYVISQIDAAAGTSATVADGGSLARNLEGLGIMALGMRYRYRMSQSASIEVIAPFWLKELLRIDLGLRQMPQDVSDAAINSWFTQRNLSVQWVYDFQDLDVDGCRTTIPSTARVLMYPAGTWAKGGLDVINVDAVYDSTGLSQNVYTALFMEEGILAVQRCTHTCAAAIPTCVSGRTAANDITSCITWPTGGDLGGEATGATAGTPGTWTPAGFTIKPNDWEEANDEHITPNPATAWTTGQYVQGATAGAAGEMNWNGTAWEAGKA